jgi:hypothetical protein
MSETPAQDIVSIDPLIGTLNIKHKLSRQFRYFPRDESLESQLLGRQRSSCQAVLTLSWNIQYAPPRQLSSMHSENGMPGQVHDGLSLYSNSKENPIIPNEYMTIPAEAP